jgi:hypothetical protein
MSEQGVREIQLNGKQLVFMFMTATVAAVVIFLCGVMVGRGVNTTRASALAAVTTEPTVDPTSTAAQPSQTSSTDASSAAPVSSQEDLKELTYAKRLESPEPPPEPAVEPVVASPVPAIAAQPKVERPQAVAPATKQVDPGGPQGNGFSSKGFPSFVTTPGSSGPKVFRVRVGKYAERREAETVARKLEKEEQFKPWITR